MLLTDYTTYGDVRAVLGVTEDDLEDTTLSLDVYVFGLEQELDDMVPSPIVKYAAITAVDASQRTEAQARFYRAMRVFCTYATAKLLLTSLPMFGAKEHSDGKASSSRFSLDPYRETIKRIESDYEKAYNRLQVALQGVGESLNLRDTGVVGFIVSSPSSNPVTG